MPHCQDCRSLRRGHFPVVGPTQFATNELLLTEELKRSLMQQGCRVVAEQWNVRSGQMHLGRGDLVVELRCGTYLVVEVSLSAKACMFITVRELKELPSLMFTCRSSTVVFIEKP